MKKSKMKSKTVWYGEYVLEDIFLLKKEDILICDMIWSIEAKVGIFQN